VAQLEARAAAHPNSLGLQLALALKYLEQRRADRATGAVRRAAALYPVLATINVNRLRLGAVGLGLASALFSIAQVLHPASFSMAGDPAAAARAASSSGFIAAQLLMLPILVLLTTAWTTLYKLLSATRLSAHAFWAMVISQVGAGLWLPSVGMRAIVLPAAGRLYLDGAPDAFAVVAAALAQPWALWMSRAVYVLLLGLSLFTLVIWLGGTLPRMAATLHWAGWLLFVTTGNDLPRLGLLAVGGLVAAGGLGLAWGLWQQAPRHAGPETESAALLAAALTMSPEAQP
jgi:hypothetical protein